MNKKQAEELCEKYFRSCDRRGRHYSMAGLMVALGADQETWEKWRRRRGLKTVLALASAKVRDNLEQREDKMALSLITKPPYAVEEEGAGPLRVVFGDGGSIEDYGE